MIRTWIKPLFWFAGIYDFALGLAFLLFGMAIYQNAGITPPNHIAYVQFPALLVMIFGVMFFRIGQNPHGERSLMPYGMSVKAAYAGVVLWHAARHEMPLLWIPFALADLVFLVLFVAAWRCTSPERPVGTP